LFLTPPPRFSSRLDLRIPREKSRIFRYLLEAYDNLAYISVVDRREAVFKVVYSPRAERALRAALEEIGRALPLLVIEL
jgi:hypothetical protein